MAFFLFKTWYLGKLYRSIDKYLSGNCDKCLSTLGRFENNQLQLQGSSAEVGEGIDLIDINYEGETFEVSFNPVFLADPLRNTDAETVKIKLNDPLAPVAIEAGEGFVYIIMPLRKK